MDTRVSLSEALNQRPLVLQAIHLYYHLICYTWDYYLTRNTPTLSMYHTGL